MANQRILDQKQLVADEIAENIKASATVIWFDNNGLTVAQQTELRRALKESGCTLKVYKNTLTRRALETLGYNIDESLVGPKVMAFGNDTIEPIKVVNDFAKKNPALEIKVGIVDGEVTEVDTLKKLAAIPSRETLLTQIAAGLMGTVKDLSIALDLYSKIEEK